MFARGERAFPRSFFFVVLALDMVENSLSLCKRILGRFSSRFTGHRGQCIRKAHPHLPGFHLHQFDHCHVVGDFSLHPRSYSEAWDRRKG